MKDVREFLENKYSEYAASAASKQYIDLKYTAISLSDDELCECIEDAPGWEVCEIHGLLDELADRANVTFDYSSDSWENDVFEAIEALKKA